MPIERDKTLRDSVITEMDSSNGISIVPDLVAIGRGYHPETGADAISFGGYEGERTQHLLTFVMPLEMAREARDLLSEQIARVDRLNAARPNTNGDTNHD